MISARRFETLTLHNVLQQLSTSECEWLHASATFKQRPNVYEMRKRREILEEFVYWYFDSFIRSLLKVTCPIPRLNALSNSILVRTDQLLRD